MKTSGSSVLVSVSQSQFSALFSYLLWHIELKFCMSLSSYWYSIRFECRLFPSIFVGVMSLLDLRILAIHSFPQYSPTCFDILSWNFACLFLLINIRSEKKKEIWPSPMTKPPIPTEYSKTKGQHTQTPPKTSITQRLRTDLGRSVGVTSNPTGVVKPVYGIPTFPLTAKAV